MPNPGFGAALPGMSPGGVPMQPIAPNMFAALIPQSKERTGGRRI